MEEDSDMNDMEGPPVQKADNKAYGISLNHLRLRVKSSVDVFAKRIGTPPEHLRAWEAGYGWPDPIVQEKIAAVDPPYSRRFITKYQVCLLVYTPPAPVAIWAPRDVPGRFKHWGEALEGFRVEAGLSPSDVAKQITVKYRSKKTNLLVERHISAETINRWERLESVPRSAALVIVPQVNELFPGMEKVPQPIFKKRGASKAPRHQPLLTEPGHRVQTNGVTRPVTETLPAPPPTNGHGLSPTRPASKPPEASPTKEGGFKVRPDSIEIPMSGDPVRDAALAIGLWKALREQ